MYDDVSLNYSRNTKYTCAQFLNYLRQEVIVQEIPSMGLIPREVFDKQHVPELLTINHVLITIEIKQL